MTQTRDELMLIVPTMDNSAEITAYRNEMLEASSSMDGCGSLRTMEDPKEYIQKCMNDMDTLSTKDNRVPATTYLCVRKSDGKVVGMTQIRHYLNWYLYQFSGHIGYSVRPSERRKGYAKWILSEGLRICASMGMTRAMVSCLDTNEASRRTILSNGGKFFGVSFEDEAAQNLEKYWVPTGLEKPFYKAIENKERTVELMAMSMDSPDRVIDVYGIDLEGETSKSSDVVLIVKKDCDLKELSGMYVENGFTVLAESAEEILLGYGYMDSKASDVSFEVHLKH